MPDWLPALVLPNIHMEEPVEAGEPLFAPWHDPRVHEVLAVDRDFTEFMQRFVRPKSEEIDTGFPEPYDLWDPQTDIERALATIHRPPRR